MKYRDLDHAIKCCFIWGKILDKVDSKVLFFSKTDLKSAFRVIPLRKNSWKWLLMKCEDPVTGEILFFIDKNIPFGSSISCSHFQRFSCALHHIVTMKTGGRMAITNYLDDFLFVGTSVRICNYLAKQFLLICAELGVPVANEKTELAATRIVFLGILLDGATLTMYIPEEKRLNAINMLNIFMDKRKATVKEMQRLAWVLNFLNKAIVPGRAFTRRMYAKFDGAVAEKNLKQYHHVRLDEEFKGDCGMWLKFLDKNQRHAVARPFLDLANHKQTAVHLHFTSDASLNEHLGFGARFNKEWCFSQWPKGFIKNKRPSIEYAELYGLCVAVCIWTPQLRNTCSIVYGDNESVLSMVNHTTSGCKNCMVLIRVIVMKSLEYNFRIFAEHISSEDNKIADSLSRLQFSRFKKLKKRYGLNDNPEPLPNEVWPIEKIWID